MSRKERTKCIIFTILLSIFCLIPIYQFKNEINIIPIKLYRVYLNGRNIGTIKSKEKLEKYIDENQQDLKEIYNVDTIYPPKGLYISEFVSYNDNSILESDIYNTIKDNDDFTIKGYIITIPSNDEDVIINVLDKEVFENSMTNVVRALVDNDELDTYLSEEEVVISYTGKKIENLYIKEQIKIKEGYISSKDKIFLDEEDLTKYLLFGDEIEEEKYKVKEGDTIESIALDNKLAVDELLVVNQDLKSKNSLLSIGQELSVALISPVVTVVVEEHAVEEKTIEYTTEIEYDGSLAWGTTKIKQEGRNGKQIVTQKIKYENGDITTALIANTKVIDEVVNKIKVIGTMSTVNVNLEDLPDVGEWYWPTKKPYIITSPYGWRWGALHDAIDISGTGNGSPIYAANNGVVYKGFTDSIGGIQVIIAHSNNYYTWYAHLSSRYVNAGDEVKAGQLIGTMGCTGSACTGTHLHFATYKGTPGRGGLSFNPLTLYK